MVITKILRILRNMFGLQNQSLPQSTLKITLILNNFFCIIRLHDNYIVEETNSIVTLSTINIIHVVLNYGYEKNSASVNKNLIA